MRSNLYLRRLIIVTEDNRYAYDERFHRGVNIIRGQNSSGKSTIIRFIFFALGGSYADFVPEALRCKMVVAEVEIGGSVYTLKRELEKNDEGRVNKMAGMYIYFGPADEVVSSSKVLGRAKRQSRAQDSSNSPAPVTINMESSLWQHYPYRSTSDTYSFSNVLMPPDTETDVSGPGVAAEFAVLFRAVRQRDNARDGGRTVDGPLR